MSRIEQRSGQDRAADEHDRTDRIARLFEIGLVAIGGVTTVWLLMSMLRVL